MTPSQPEESAHARVQRIRREITALQTIEESEARTNGATPVTSTYYTRLIGQCEMLLRAIASETGAHVVLVKTRSGIAIWRRKA